MGNGGGVEAGGDVGDADNDVGEDGNVDDGVSGDGAVDANNGVGDNGVGDAADGVGDDVGDADAVSVPETEPIDPAGGSQQPV